MKNHDFRDFTEHFFMDVGARRRLGAADLSRKILKMTVLRAQTELWDHPRHKSIRNHPYLSIGEVSGSFRWLSERQEQNVLFLHAYWNKPRQIWAPPGEICWPIRCYRSEQGCWLHSTQKVFLGARNQPFDAPEVPLGSTNASCTVLTSFKHFARALRWFSTKTGLDLLQICLFS